MIIKKSLFVSTAFIAMVAPRIAYAQAAPNPVSEASPRPTTSSQAVSETTPEDTEQSAARPAANPEPIVVTGSRIPRPNLNSPVPIVSLTGDEFINTGGVSVGDVLNELPALRSTMSTQNSTAGIGTVGLNLLDLRGLDPKRTLVLVNGRRHVSSRAGDSVVDVNTIPSTLIDRVDVVTGGSSAVYGSDAIAGVVNFILKRDFEGVQFRGRTGISSRGDAGNYLLSGTAGMNFADDRGNVAVAAEYARQDPLFAPARPGTRTNQFLTVVDTDPAGTPNGSDGVPDRIWVVDSRSATWTDGGTVGDCSSTTPVAQRPARCLPGGNIARLYEFLPDGTLAEWDYGRRDFRSPLGIPAFDGGSGSSARNGKQVWLFPSTERFTANLLAQFEVSPALVPFAEAKFVRTDNMGGALGATFFNTAPNGTFRFDNPYLSPQALSLLRTLYPTGSTFTLRRNNADLGARDTRTKRDTWRLVGGVRGNFNDDWSYEVSANYGWFNEDIYNINNLDLQRFRFATDAVRDTNGNIVCRVTVDPAARIPTTIPNMTSAQAAGFAARLAEDVANCRPLNLFGDGAADPAAIAYAMPTTRGKAKTTQFVLNAFMTGDSSEWFELPGGPIGFAVGGEYRRETAGRVYEDRVALGGTFFNAIAPFDPPRAFEVKEAFGELRLPILANVPLFHELTVEGAARVADYKGNVGTVVAWNTGVKWAPVQDILFRGNFSRAVRAPDLAELYTPETQSFVSGFVDPCHSGNIGSGAPTRSANCIADGMPVGYSYVQVGSLEVVNAGNPNLMQETSDSWTAGIVLRPRFIPGFTLSADYFDVRVDNIITSVGASAIVAACYDAASIDNVFCSLFQRDPVTFRIVPASIRQSPVNFAKRTSKGVDVEASYRTNIARNTRLSTNLILTYVEERNDYPFQNDPNRADQILHELGDPQWSFNWSVDLKHKGLSLGYQMRYLGKMTVGAAENVYSVNGQPPQNADFAEINFFPETFYHDARVGYDVNERLGFLLGVDNITDKLPPFGLTGTGGGGIYDIRGRYFYAGATVKF